MTRSLKALAVYLCLAALTMLWIVAPTGAGAAADGSGAPASVQAQRQPAGPEVPSFDFLRSPPVGRVSPESGSLSIQLINTIGAPITYQVVTDTAQRSLPANSDIVLQNLSLPVSIFLYRPDTGLIQATAATEPGQLQVTLEAATDLADNVRSIELDDAGYVFFE
ncbi:MAG: hypothetical protein ACFB4J_10820 [Elainellaceae cyanobacterium]